MFKTHKFTKSFFLAWLLVVFPNMLIAEINVSAGYTEIELQTFEYKPKEEAPQSAEIEIVEGYPVYQAIDGKEVQTEDFIKLAEETRQKMLKDQSKIYFKQKAIKNVVASILTKNSVEYIDLGTSLIVQKLTPEQIAELYRNFFFVKDIQENITISDNEAPDYMDINKTLDYTDIKAHGFKEYPSYSGGRSKQNQDIGIMQWEPSCPNPDSKLIDSSKLTVHSQTDNTYINHANRVAYILQNASDHVHVHCTKNFIDIQPPASYATTSSPAVHIINMSNSFRDNGSNKNDEKTYTKNDKKMDNLILKHRVAAFIVTGNLDTGDIPKGRKNVRSPGRAYNTITVGYYTEVDSDDKVEPVVYGNPETGAEKPELIMHGHFKFPRESGSGTISRDGSSYATPLVASGFGANLLSQYPILQYHPELLKAYLMTMSKNMTTETGAVNDKEGAGMPFYENAFSTYWTWWRSSNINYFFNKKESDGTRYVTRTRYLQKGEKYRVATSWLVEGTYAEKNKAMNMDFELEVYRGSEKYTAPTNKSNFRLVEFTAKYSGTYTMKIKRTDYKQGVIYLGLASTKIDK